MANKNLEIDGTIIIMVVFIIMFGLVLILRNPDNTTALEKIIDSLIKNEQLKIVK